MCVKKHWTIWVWKMTSLAQLVPHIPLFSGSLISDNNKIIAHVWRISYLFRVRPQLLACWILLATVCQAGRFLVLGSLGTGSRKGHSGKLVVELELVKASSFPEMLRYEPDKGPPCWWGPERLALPPCCFRFLKQSERWIPVWPHLGASSSIKLLT